MNVSVATCLLPNACLLPTVCFPTVCFPMVSFQLSVFQILVSNCLFFNCQNFRFHSICKQCQIQGNNFFSSTSELKNTKFRFALLIWTSIPYKFDDLYWQTPIFDLMSLTTRRQSHVFSINYTGGWMLFIWSNLLPPFYLRSQAKIVEMTFVVSRFSDIHKEEISFLVVPKRNNQELLSYSVVSARNEQKRHN